MPLTPCQGVKVLAKLMGGLSWPNEYFYFILIQTYYAAYLSKRILIYDEFDIKNIL